MAQHDASLKSYLREIARYPLLTPDQEICYGRQIMTMQAIAARGGELSAEDRRAIRVGLHAKRKFVCSNLKLVVSIAKKYSTEQRKSLELMDLIQEGNIGLARAVELFDPSRGYRFTTYAYWWIRQSIHRAIAQMDAMVRIPVSLYDKLVRATRVGHELYQRYGRPATTEELAKELGVPVDTLLIGIRRNQMHTSLDRTPSGNEEGTIGEVIPDPKQPDIYSELDMGQATDKAVRAFDDLLDPITKYVLTNRLTEVPMPWKEMHRRSKLPVSKLQSIEQAGLRKLRVALTMQGISI